MGLIQWIIIIVLVAIIIFGFSAVYYCSIDNPYDPLPNHYFLNKALLEAGYAKIMYGYCERSEFKEELCYN